MVAVLVTLVAAGTTHIRTCPDCGEDRADTEMCGLTEAGTITIGLMVSCAGCGESWRCAFCPAVLPMDGATAYRHMAAEHASD